jgi:hypothetical protein
MLAAAVTIGVMNGASQSSVTNDGSNLDAMIATRSVLIGACNFRLGRAPDTAQRIVESITSNYVTSVVANRVMCGVTSVC